MTTGLYSIDFKHATITNVGKSCSRVGTFPVNSELLSKWRVNKTYHVKENIDFVFYSYIGAPFAMTPRGNKGTEYVMAVAPNTINGMVTVSDSKKKMTVTREAEFNIDEIKDALCQYLGIENTNNIKLEFDVEVLNETKPSLIGIKLLDKR